MLKQLKGGLVFEAAKVFITSKFRFFFFPNPTHKTETGTANKRKTIKSNPHLDQ